MNVGKVGSRTLRVLTKAPARTHVSLSVRAASQCAAPGSSSSSHAGKNRKKKVEVAEAPSSGIRKATPKALPPKVKQAIVKPLLEQWVDHRNAVEEMLRGLEKPEDARNIYQITEMQKHLLAMSKMTTDMSVMPQNDLMARAAAFIG